jgi:hypothetical protein
MGVHHCWHTDMDKDPIGELKPLSPARLEELAWHQRAQLETLDSDHLRQVAKQLLESANSLRAEAERLERRAAEMEKTPSTPLP